MNCDGLMRDCVLSHLGTRSNCAHGIGEGVRGRGWRLVIDIFFWGGVGGMPKKGSPDSRFPEVGISVIRVRR